MDTLSYVLTNTLHGAIGGASSIIPIVIIYVNFEFIQKYLSQQMKYTDAKIDSINMYNNFPLIISTICGIAGGVLSNNYNESINNGITYGILTTIFSSAVMLYYNNNT